MGKGKKRRGGEESFWTFFFIVLALSIVLPPVVVFWEKYHTWLILGIILLAIIAGGIFVVVRFAAVRRLVFGGKAPSQENIPNKKPGRKPVSPSLREQVFKRAKYRCENPDCRHDKFLDIHHIDENRANNEMYNLIALCPSCHADCGCGEYSQSTQCSWIWMEYNK